MVPKSRTSFFFCRSKSKKKQKRKLQPRNITNRYGSIFAVFQHTNTHRGTKVLFRCVVVEKSIRETVPTKRVELIVSTFPMISIFSVSPTLTHTILTFTHFIGVILTLFLFFTYFCLHHLRPRFEVQNPKIKTDFQLESFLLHDFSSLLNVVLFPPL